MRRAADELAEAAQAALVELRHVEAALERAARDTTDRHLAGRIRDAAIRVDYVARALGQELDRHNPSRAMLQKLLAGGAAALGLVGLPLVVDDVSDRIDTIDIAGELIESIVDLLGEHRPSVEHAAAGYFVQLERFEASRRTINAPVSFRGEGSLDLAEPRVAGGGSGADVLTDGNGEPHLGESPARAHQASASGASRSSGSATATGANPGTLESSVQVPRPSVRTTDDVAGATDTASGGVSQTLRDPMKDAAFYSTANVVEEEESDVPSERYNEGDYGDGTYQGDGD